MEKNSESSAENGKDQPTCIRRPVVEFMNHAQRVVPFLGTSFVVWFLLPMAISWGVTEFDSRGIQDFPTFALIHGIPKSTLETDIWMRLYLGIFSNSIIAWGAVMILFACEFSYYCLFDFRKSNKLQLILSSFSPIVNVVVLIIEVFSIKFLASIQ